MVVKKRNNSNAGLVIKRMRCFRYVSNKIEMRSPKEIFSMRSRNIDHKRIAQYINNFLAINETIIILGLRGNLNNINQI